MANKTVVFTNYFLNGTSGLTLLLLDPVTAAIGNGAGDTLTAGSNGLFSAVVTEAITGWWNIVVLQGAVVVLEGGKVYFQSNAAGTYQVDDATHAADAVLDEPYADHNIAGTIGKLLNTIRKSNLAIDGVVSNAITPTTLTFSSNVSATTSAYAHAVLLFVSGPLTGENSPIISYNNTNGVFLLEEPLTAAPSDGDEFVVIANSHVHAISDIQSGLATSSGLANAFTEIKGAGWSSSTDTLEKIADSIGDISVDNQAIAEAVWEYLQNNEITNGSMAEILIRLWDMTELNSDGDPWFTSIALLQAPTFRLPARGRGNTVPTAPTLKVYRTQTIHDTLYVYGPDGTTPVDLRGRNLKMVFERIDGTDVGVLTDFTIIGADHNGLYFQYTSGITSVLGTRKWNLWDADTTEMLLDGTLEIAYAAIED